MTIWMQEIVAGLSFIVFAVSAYVLALAGDAVFAV
jgi:hypothetical protein